MAKKRNVPRHIQVAGKSHQLCVFRVVEINQEQVLKYIGYNEVVQLKTDGKLNRFVTGFIATEVAQEFEDEANGR